MRIYSIKKAIDIPEYKITGIIFESKEERHLRLEPYQRRPFTCSGCGEIHKVGYHGKEESIVEDLSIFGKRMYLHVTKRRYVCPQDNRTHIEKVTWLNRWSRTTKRFAQMANRLTAITTNQETGWFLGLADETVYRMDKEILEMQVAAACGNKHQRGGSHNAPHKGVAWRI